MSRWQAGRQTGRCLVPGGWLVGLDADGLTDWSGLDGDYILLLPNV